MNFSTRASDSVCPSACRPPGAASPDARRRRRRRAALCGGSTRLSTKNGYYQNLGIAVTWPRRRPRAAIDREARAATASLGARTSTTTRVPDASVACSSSARSKSAFITTTRGRRLLPDPEYVLRLVQQDERARSRPLLLVVTSDGTVREDAGERARLRALRGPAACTKCAV